jgi:hypothetical protein
MRYVSVGLFAVMLMASPVLAQEPATKSHASGDEAGMFMALQTVPTQLNALSDTELATVEGGTALFDFQKSVAAAFFGAAFLYALNHDFLAAANSSVAGSLIGTQITGLPSGS